MRVEMHPDVAGYLLRAPADQRPHLEDLRHLILEHFPDAEEAFERFPVYTRDGTWLAGFATRAKGMMFYLMDHATLDDFDERLGRLRSGRGCIEYRATRERTLPELRQLVSDMLSVSARRRRQTATP